MRRLLTLVILAGCDGRKDANGGPHCKDTPTVVAVDEVTALGFAAQDLLDLATGDHVESFTWARDGSTTGLALAVRYAAGEARFVDSEAVYPEGDGPTPAIGVICDDRVEVDVAIDFATDDGAFAEGWDLALQGVASHTAEFYRELDPDGLRGSYQMDDDITEPDYDERGLWAAGSFASDGARGEVAGQVSGSEECDPGDVCSAWAGEVEVGQWGADGR